MYPENSVSLLECNTSTYFNEPCLSLNMFQNYANIKISNTSPGSKFTQQKVLKLYIRDELKLLI
jgi:hypothetical protein